MCLHTLSMVETAKQALYKLESLGAGPARPPFRRGSCFCLHPALRLKNFINIFLRLRAIPLGWLHLYSSPTFRGLSGLQETGK